MNSKMAKFAPVLVLTFALGIGITQTVRRLAPANKGFTFDEARSHLHMRVRNNFNHLKCRTCIVKDEQTVGRTILFEKDAWDGQYRIAVDWDMSFRSRHEVIFYDKENYEKWVTETGPSED